MFMHLGASARTTGDAEMLDRASARKLQTLVMKLNRFRLAQFEPEAARESSVGVR
jgi:hypothetical protein